MLTRQDKIFAIFEPEQIRKFDVEMDFLSNNSQRFRNCIKPRKVLTSSLWKLMYACFGSCVFLFYIPETITNKKPDCKPKDPRHEHEDLTRFPRISRIDQHSNLLVLVWKEQISKSFRQFQKLYKDGEEERTLNSPVPQSRLG